MSGVEEFMAGTRHVSPVWSRFLRAIEDSEKVEKHLCEQGNYWLSNARANTRPGGAYLSDARLSAFIMELRVFSEKASKKAEVAK
jgi:hypothetical protein